MSNPINDGGSAFPCQPVDTLTHGWQHPSQVVADTGGMSLRDWFAGMALQGILACPEGYRQRIEVNAARAYDMADAMLTARTKGGRDE